MVVLLGKTWRLPVLWTVPSPGSIVTDVASLTDQRNVAACPRSIELGSAENWATVGALGGGATGVSFGGGGGGGGAAATGFFLHPAANIIKKTLSRRVAIFRLLNSVLQVQIHLPQIGISFLPCVVSCWTCVPSASMVKICIEPLRLDANTRCRPSGAQFGFSFFPAP